MLAASLPPAPPDPPPGPPDLSPPNDPLACLFYPVLTITILHGTNIFFDALLATNGTHASSYWLAQAFFLTSLGDTGGETAPLRLSFFLEFRVFFFEF